MNIKRILISTFHEIEKACENLVYSLENNCYEVFKGGVFLIGVSLAGLSQTMPVMLEHEYKAMELRYSFEAKSNIKLSEAKCEDFKYIQQECNLAKYKNKVVSSTVGLLNTVVKNLLYFGVMMLVLSVIGYSITMGQKSPNTAPRE